MVQYKSATCVLLSLNLMRTSIQLNIGHSASGRYVRDEAALMKKYEQNKRNFPPSQRQSPPASEQGVYASCPALDPCEGCTGDCAAHSGTPSKA